MEAEVYADVRLPLVAMHRLLLVLVVVGGGSTVRAQISVSPAADAALHRAQEALQRDDRTAARAGYEEAALLKPRNGMVQLSVSAGLMLMMANTDEADWGAVLPHSRLATDLLTVQLDVAVRNGQVSRVDADHTLSSAHAVRADLAARMARGEEGATHLEEARRLWPQNPAMASPERSLSFCDPAVGDAMSLVQLNAARVQLGADGPEAGESFVRAAEAFRQCGYFANAVVTYEMALAVSPGLESATEGLRRARAEDNQ